MARRRTKQAGQTARAREMRRVLGRWARSGLTLRAFAAREGLAPGTLSWWHHVLRPRPGARPTRPRRRPGAFVEVPNGVPVRGAGPGVVEVVLPRGVVVRVTGSVPRTVLREVVAALDDTC